MRPRLISFSGQEGSGKTFCADLLCSRYGYVKIKMAKPIKDMIRALGLNDNHIEGHLKDVPCELLDGRTPRWAMQSLGVEWGRSLISENLWLNRWAEIVHQNLAMSSSVVVDDTRFPNELNKVRELNGLIIGLKRNATNDESHSSSFNSWEDLNADFIIENDDSWDEFKLEMKMHSIMSQLDLRDP